MPLPEGLPFDLSFGDPASLVYDAAASIVSDVDAPSGADVGLGRDTGSASGAGVAPTGDDAGFGADEGDTPSGLDPGVVSLIYDAAISIEEAYDAPGGVDSGVGSDTGTTPTARPGEDYRSDIGGTIGAEDVATGEAEAVLVISGRIL